MKANYDNLDQMVKEAEELKKQGKIKIVHVYLGDLKKEDRGMYVNVPGVGEAFYSGD
jgi:hypothetical protein